METNCVFCGKETKSDYYKYDNDIFIYECPNCGHYKITYEASQDLPRELEKKYSDRKHLISGYLRELTDLNISSEIISNTNYERLFHSAILPTTMMEKLDKLLSYIYRKTKYLFQSMELDLTKPAYAYAKSDEEYKNMLTALQSLELINYKSDYYNPTKPEVSLTIKGIEKAESLRNIDFKESSQGFVAMWFDKSMLDIYHEYIAKAIEKTGYKPLIISQKQHNDKICDHIIAEIRKSRFLVADFTGGRGGVYFEAGFAYGLGLPVIWTCRQDDLDKLHFDINHYNFIVWKDGEDLYQQLVDRIEATIPLK